jgi:hypothetical protein
MFDTTAVHSWSSPSAHLHQSLLPLPAVSVLRSTPTLRSGCSNCSRPWYASRSRVPRANRGPPVVRRVRSAGEPPSEFFMERKVMLGYDIPGTCHSEASPTRVQREAKRDATVVAEHLAPVCSCCSCAHCRIDQLCSLEYFPACRGSGRGTGVVGASSRAKASNTDDVKTVLVPPPPAVSQGSNAATPDRSTAMATTCGWTGTPSPGGSGRWPTRRGAAYHGLSPTCSGARP